MSPFAQNILTEVSSLRKNSLIMWKHCVRDIQVKARARDRWCFEILAPYPTRMGISWQKLVYITVRSSLHRSMSISDQYLFNNESHVTLFSKGASEFWSSQASLNEQSYLVLPQSQVCLERFVSLSQCQQLLSSNELKNGECIRLMVRVCRQCRIR